MHSPLSSKTKEYVTEVVATSAKSKDPPTTTGQPNLTLQNNPRGSPESEEDTRGPPMQCSPQQSAHSDDQSLPDSLFQINCRCGLKGDGNQLYRANEGRAIQCDECRDWSHIACQRDGRADGLRPKDPFICDICDASSVLDQDFYQKQRASARKRLETRTRHKKALNRHLLAGRGGLARNGDFWYPVRLLQHHKKNKKWSVRWWRGCDFGPFPKTPSAAPGLITQINEADLVDSLWGDRTARRATRLGKWMHAHEIPSADDILADPSFAPHTPEIHAALSPSIENLKAVLNDPESQDSSLVPAKAWLEGQRINVRTGLVRYMGNLPIIEQAQLMNWFETHVALGNKTLRLQWFGRLPIAHTCTLYIVALLRTGRWTRVTFKNENEMLEYAWKIQTDDPPLEKVFHNIDVDRECLAHLEEEIFERSALAGSAGNFQWGLDAGDHQEGWNPYDGTPFEWNHNDRESSEGEHEVGPGYVKIKKPIKEVKPQPKPRPVGRKRAVSKKK